MITAQQLVILDRDGVINHDSDAYIKSLDGGSPTLLPLARLPALPRQALPWRWLLINPASPVASTMKLR